MKNVIYIGVACILMAFGFAKKIDFKFLLKPDVNYIQTVESSNAITQEVQGQSMTMNNTVKGVTQLSLKEKTKTGGTYNAKYRELAISISMLGQTQKFTSSPATADSLDQMSQVMSKVVDKDFTVDISTSGEVSNVQGLTQILEKATEATENEIGGAQLKEQLMMSIGDLGLINNLETTTTILPEGEVNIGDTWKEQMNSTSGFPLKVAAAFTLKSVDNGVATIELKAKITTDAELAKTEVQGMEATYSLSGIRKGMVQVEIETGWTTTGNFTDSIAGNISISPNMQIPDGMQVPVRSISKTSITSRQE